MTNELHLVDKDILINILDDYAKMLEDRNLATESAAIKAVTDIIKNDVATLTISYLKKEG